MDFELLSDHATAERASHRLTSNTALMTSLRGRSHWATVIITVLKPLYPSDIVPVEQMVLEV
jgi:hypothetical protein